MAVAIQTKSVLTKVSSDATGITITKPSETADGDLLIALVWKDDDPVITSDSSEFTQIQQGDSGGANSPRVSAWYREAGASEPDDYSWSGDSEQWLGIIYRIDGQAASGFIDNSAMEHGSSNAPTSPDITPTVNDCLIIAFFGADDDDTPYTLDAALSSDFNDVSGTGSGTVGGAGGNEIQTTATATGQYTHGMNATEEWTGITIAIAPLVSGSTFEEAITLAITNKTSIPTTVVTFEGAVPLAITNKTSVPTTIATFEGSLIFNKIKTLSLDTDAIFETAISENIIKQDSYIAGLLFDDDISFDKFLGSSYDTDAIFEGSLPLNIVKQDSFIGNLIFEDALSFNNVKTLSFIPDNIIEVATSENRILTGFYIGGLDLNSALTFTKFLDDSEIANITIDENVALNRVMAFSMVENIIFEGAISLDNTRAISLVTDAIFEANLTLSNIKTLVNTTDMTFEANIALNSIKGLNINSDIVFETLLSIAKNLSLASESDIIIEASIGADKFLAVSFVSEVSAGGNTYEESISLGKTLAEVFGAELIRLDTSELRWNGVFWVAQEKPGKWSSGW